MNEPAASPMTDPAAPRSRRAALVALGGHLLPALVASALAGFLVGGVGGRLAMFALRLTSSPEVIGLESDDGFIIGRFSIDTLNLLLGTTIGATLVVGPIYALLRLWLPERWRSPTLAAFFAVVGGSVLVQREGVDFTVLSPRVLAIALFVAIPAVFGAMLEPLHSLAERWTHPVPANALLGIAVLGSGWPILLGTEGLGAVVGLIVIAAVLFGPAERLGAALTSSPVTWLARLGMTALAVFAAGDLAEDVRALLL